MVLDTVTVQLGTAVPPPGVPGPFALDDPDRLGRLLTGAGLADVVVDQVPVPLHDDSFDAWLTRTAVEQVRAGERNLGPAPVVTIAPQPDPAAGGDVDPLIVLLLGLVGGLIGGLAIAAGVAANRRHGQRAVAA